MSKLYVPKILRVCLMVREDKKGKTQFEKNNFKLEDPGSIPSQSMMFSTLDRLVIFFHLPHRYVVKIVLTEGKKKKSTVWELWVKFYLGQMRTVPQGIAFQIALRNCSREASGKVSIYVLLVNKKYTHFCRRLLLVSEKAMAPHSSTLAWKLPWTEEPGRLQSMGSLRVGHNWVTSLSLFTFMHWRRKWQPTPVCLPWESQGRGSLVGCHLWGHAESDMTEAT